VSLSMAAPVRRLFTMGAAAALAVGMLAGPVAAQDVPMGGDFVVGIEGDIVAFDPAFAYDFTANPVVCEVTEGLTKFQDGKVVPNLAESVTTSEDGLTWTYVLRQGVMFHDGTEMTADDVVYSMERIRSPETASYVGWMYGSVDTIEKVDDYTVVVTLKNNDAFWQYVTATTAGHIISQDFAEAHPEDLGTPDVGVVGTGPFKFESWASGDQIVLTRNDDYWDKANGGPYLDTVTFKVLVDATTRTAGLQTGELSAVLGAIPGDQLPLVQVHIDWTQEPVDALVGEDPGAYWDGATVRNSQFAVSPRIVPIALYDPDALAAQPTLSEGSQVVIRNIVGIFIIDFTGSELRAVVVPTAGRFDTSAPAVPDSASFLRSIALVR